MFVFLSASNSRGELPLPSVYEDHAIDMSLRWRSNLAFSIVFDEATDTDSKENVFVVALLRVISVVFDEASYTDSEVPALLCPSVFTYFVRPRMNPTKCTKR